ncbi:hypothetical protein HU200_048891 [Digitaria exilis]|uniref:Uncharacterized protein n=1 Tax=Digitaria exilis TaxID=1010633 RepID=A0A835B0X2_9POAL|nr:hypothetical protein HU200_048891 [Digitaria exilis]
MKISVESSKSRSIHGRGTPLTVLDRVNFDQYISTLYFFSPQAAKALPNAILQQGHSKTLAMHREWAGRFGLDANGNPGILLNNEGARFIEATDDIALCTIMPVEPTPELLSLYPSDDGANELMLVQVTRFACGSLAVAVNGNHLMSDGYGRCSFMTAWANATRGIEFEHRGVKFKQPPHCDALDDMEKHAHASGGGDKVVVRRVHFSTVMVSELKTLASSPNAPCISKARGLDGEIPTTLKIAVNGRHRMHHPEVPEAGNVVLWACPTITKVARVDDTYFNSGVVEKEGLVPVADPTMIVLCPDVEVNSLVGIPVNDVDFGAGLPFLFMHGYLPQEGLVFITSSSSGDGSIDAQVSLFSGTMDIFKNWGSGPAAAALDSFGGRRAIASTIGSCVSQITRPAAATVESEWGSPTIHHGWSPVRWSMACFSNFA